MNEMLKLRDDGFWSFRGQRRQEWNLGLHDTPEDLTLVDECLKQFRKRCMEFPRPDYLDEDPKWRWLFYAQHYRLKTQLLDWTTNPLVALYFAVENILSRCKDEEYSQCIEEQSRRNKEECFRCSKEKHFGVVWALKVHPDTFKTPEELGSPAKLERWMMINPPPVTQRLARQSGKFSYHPKPNEQLDLIPRRPLEVLKKFVITSTDGRNPTRKIREQLGIMNIHHASLFPDPEGVAEFVNSEWPIIATDRYPRTG
jgi:hypothetical protein